MVLRVRQSNAKGSKGYGSDWDKNTDHGSPCREPEIQIDVRATASGSSRQTGCVDVNTQQQNQRRPTTSHCMNQLSPPSLEGPSSQQQASQQTDPSVSSHKRMGTTFSIYNAIHRVMRLFRRAITGVRFDELDPEIYELPTPRYKPECIDNLCKITNFSRKELQTIYRSFKQACPSGLATESLLHDMYAQFFPHGDSSLYAHFVFKTFDQDGNGSLSFEEFVMGLSSLSRGTLEQKLHWAFNLYDINGDGCITREELNEIVMSIYSLMGKDACFVMDEHTPREHVDRVFKKMDLNEDGVVTIEEFMEICQKDESIRRSITALETIL